MYCAVGASGKKYISISSFHNAFAPTATNTHSLTIRTRIAKKPRKTNVTLVRTDGSKTHEKNNKCTMRLMNEVPTLQTHLLKIN